MIIKKTIIIFSLLISFSSIIISQDTQEIRAVWVATNYRLDWPPPTFNTDIQKKSLIEIFDSIKSKNLNAIYFQVRSNGTVLFRSSYEPFSFYLDGKGGMPYDPLQYAIEEAHKRNLKLHAWINTVLVFEGKQFNIINNPEHVVRKKTEWIIEYYINGEKSYWLNPAIPEVRIYISDIIKELVEKYNIDGIHLDYIRYPGDKFNDDSLYYTYGKGLSRSDWRRKNITDLVELIYQKVKSTKPNVQIGATPIGIYKNHNNMYGLEGYEDVYQDSREWLRKNLVDYITPQVYWTFNENVKFDVVAKEWIDNSFGKKVIIGIGAFKDDVKNKIDTMIQYTRNIGAKGFALFRYSYVKDLRFQKIFNEIKSDNVESIKEDTFEPVNFSLLNGNYLKPRFAKKSRYYSEILIFSENDEYIEVIGVNENDEEIIIKQKIKPGKNIIEIKHNVEKYNEILLLFKSSNKMMRIKL